MPHRKSKLGEFDEKVALVTKAISKTLRSIEGKRVQPWNFGLMKDGSLCGVIKSEEIANDELFLIKDAASAKGFRVVLACDGYCYEIGDAIKKYSGYSAASMKDEINNEISRFRMSLIKL